jgi:serine protease inhibitor ecotin
MLPIHLGKQNTPIDWTQLQQRAMSTLGRMLRVDCREGGIGGERLSNTELEAMGFEYASGKRRYSYGKPD